MKDWPLTLGGSTNTGVQVYELSMHLNNLILLFLTQLVFKHAESYLNLPERPHHQHSCAYNFMMHRHSIMHSHFMMHNYSLMHNQFIMHNCFMMHS